MSEAATPTEIDASAMLNTGQKPTSMKSTTPPSRRRSIVLLAVPLTAFVKLVSDCHPSLIHISSLLAEKPQPPAQWAQIDTGKVARSIPFLGKRLQTTAKDKQPHPSTPA